MKGLSPTLGVSWLGKTINLAASEEVRDVVLGELAGLNDGPPVPGSPTIAFTSAPPVGTKEIMPAHLGLRSFLRAQDTTLHLIQSPKTLVVLSPGPNRLVVRLLLAMVFKHLHWPTVLFFEATSVLLQSSHAILLMGDGGAGKSTMAVACLRKGARLISDDITPLATVNGRPEALPLMKCLDIPDGASNWVALRPSDTQLADPGCSYPVREVFLLEGPGEGSGPSSVHDVHGELVSLCTSLYEDPFDWRTSGDMDLPRPQLWGRLAEVVTRVPWERRSETRIAAFAASIAQKTGG